jgi:hypothetical protein
VTQIPTWTGGHANPTNGRAAPGTIIGGRYTLRTAVGHGGMGTVWRAADTLLRRDVAVKEVILPPGLAPSDRDAMYERTLREARAAAALQHPAVVQVYDVVHEDGRPWIVMELLDARSLADMVIEDGPVAPRAVAKIGIALLGALEVAHAYGVLHRDVKPANVLICSDGRCVLTDFGVARMPTDVQLTTPGMVLGSPHFISPERAMGSDFGPPSDLFSLGVTLYTAVEGRPPFDKGDPIETMHSVVEDPPAPVMRAGSLTNVLMGLLEKDPARRYDVHTARTLLRQLLAGPLASKAPVHMTTDPYAVVQAQRPSPAQPAPPPAPAKPQPTGQIGGRAMLAPGESLTDRLAKLREGGRQLPSDEQWKAAGLTRDGRSAADVPTGPHPAPAGKPAGAHSAGQPTGAHPAGAHSADKPTGAYPAGQPTGAYPAPRSGDTTDVIPPRERWMPPGGVDGRMPGTVVTGAAARRRAVLDTAVQRFRSLAATVRGWPRNVQLAAGAGLAVVVVLSAVVLFSSDDPEQTPPPQAGVSATPVPAAFPTQRYAARGVSVNVPQTWERATGGSYVDFVDPADDGRKVRILVERSTAEPVRFLEIAEQFLKTRSKSCVKPYTRVGLRDAEVGGQPSAELEYTCGTGDRMRHGVWRAIVQDGKAYSFYMTTTEARFAESLPVFQEMVNTFKVTDAG